MTTNWLRKNRYLLSILWCTQADIACLGLYLLQISPQQNINIGEWTLNLRSIDGMEKIHLRSIDDKPFKYIHVWFIITFHWNKICPYN